VRNSLNYIGSYTLISYVQRYMLEMIAQRRQAEKKEERYDLFSSLLDASDAEADGSVKLNESELLGEKVILIYRGHSAERDFHR
jgi:cytochrome P450